MVCGQGEIEGRAAVVQGDDFTVRGGAADAAIWQKMVFAERLAHDLRLPLVRLVDGTGGGGSVKSLEQMGYTYVPFIPGMELAIANLARVPVVAAALGPVAGLGAARVVASHFSVIVRGTSQLFVAGPPVVAAAMGESPDKEALGGSRMQTRAGAVDNEAADEDDALDQLKRFLSYLPPSAWELPPVAAATDPADRREEALLSIVPRDPRKPYDMRAVLDAVCDLGSVFELGRAPRALADLRARAARRPPGRRARLGPQALRRRPDRRRLGQARALRRPLRPVPPAGGQPRRPARLRDRLGGRARRHDAPRRARAVRRPPGDRAVGVGARSARSTAWPAPRTATPRG